MDAKNKWFLVGNCCLLVALLSVGFVCLRTYDSLRNEAQIALESASAYKKQCEMYLPGTSNIDWALVLSPDTKERWHIAVRLFQDLKSGGADYRERYEALIRYLEENYLTLNGINTTKEEVDKILKEHALDQAAVALRSFMYEENPDLEHFRNFERHLRYAGVTYADYMENGEILIPKLKQKIAKEKIVYLVSRLRENSSWYDLHPVEKIEECLKFAALRYKDVGLERQNIVRLQEHAAAELAFEKLARLRTSTTAFSHEFEDLERYLMGSGLSYEDIGTDTEEIQYLKAKHQI